MAYNHKYTYPFVNKRNESIVVDLYEQDGVGDLETLQGEFPGVILEKNALSTTGKFHTIVTTTATIRLRITAADNVDHLTFIQSTYEKWMVIITQDGTAVFHGFLIPEVGRIPLKDKPYVIELKATDGLGLLKNYALTDPTGLRFDGRNTLISYWAGALAKITTFLPLRVYCNIYHSSMTDRSDADHYDMTQQVKLHHRTFLKDDGDFVSCYEALELTLKGHFTLFYDAGSWVIYRIPEYTQITDVWYTDYDGGIPQVGVEENVIAVPVGISELIQPINADAMLSNEIAIKSAKHSFPYVIPVDLVNNQKLNRLGDFIAPLSGVGYAAYELVGWTQKSGTLAGAGMFPVSAVNAYIKTETNVYGIETNRYYVIEHDGATNAYPLDNFIINDNNDFWVQAGDRLGVSVETRLKLGQTPPPDTHECLLVAILKDGTGGGSISDWYTLNPNGTWQTNGANMNRDISGSVDETQWETISVTDEYMIPVNGRVFIWLGTGGVDNGNEAHFRNLQLHYSPMVRGSLATVKGDYWTRSQTDSHIDADEVEVGISDAPTKLIKGALWEESGETLTSPEWYRYGTSEERHFKELVNIGHFQQYYRRMLSVEGTFRGIKSNDGVAEVPLSMAKRYTFVDSPLVQRNYILVPPLRIDMDSGTFQGKFIEVYRDSNDLTEEGDTATFNYYF